SELGEDCSRAGPGFGNDDRMEAYCSYGWRKNRKGSPHLRTRRGREITAMGTIMAADGFGLPVSTTHVLSSGVAGTMAANRTGLQMETVRNLLLAWVLTLPAAMMLSGFLFWMLRSFV